MIDFIWNCFLLNCYPVFWRCPRNAFFDTYIIKEPSPLTYKISTLIDSFYRQISIKWPVPKIYIHISCLCISFISSIILFILLSTLSIITLPRTNCGLGLICFTTCLYFVPASHRYEMRSDTRPDYAYFFFCNYFMFWLLFCNWPYCSCYIQWDARW